MPSGPAARVLPVAFLLLAAGLAAAPPAAAQEAPVKLLVLGETHGTRQVTRDLVSIADAKGATGCVCPGDFIYGHWSATPSGWRDMMAPFGAAMMPAQGNHDWPWSDWRGMFPDGAPYYSKDVNGVQFIALNPEHSSLARGSTQRVWLEARLAERDPGALKVVFLHRPWWLPSGAVHPTSEFESKAGTSAATMDGLMRTHGVDLVVSAHEKNYQHSFRDGVHYLVAGGGGPEFYGLGYDLPGAVLRLRANVVSTLDVTPTSMTLRSYDLSWKTLEEFTMTTGAAPAPAPAPSAWQPDAESFPVRTTGGSATRADFDGGRGWNLWANGHVEQTADAALAEGEVVVRAAGNALGGVAPVMVVSVGGREVGRASVGASAAEHAFPAGAVRAGDAVRVAFVNDARSSTEDRNLLLDTVRLRAASGALAPQPTPEPAPEPQPAPGGGFAAAFSDARGNNWWVEVEVEASGGTLAGVDARVDGGAWRALERRSWGSWAATMRAPTGSTVEFQARSDAGAAVVSAPCRWPPADGCASTATSGEPAPAPAPAPTSGFDATFSKARGNAWWVEVEVKAAGGTLAGVDARVNGGAWVALGATSWGSWAKTVAAPSGSTVEFRARATDGATDTSAAYAWPPA